MACRRCSTCGINYPSSFTICRVCGEVNDWMTEPPDDDWERASDGKIPAPGPVDCLNRDLFFDKWGEDGDLAYGILTECEVPPSLEVFEHGLEAARERSHLPIPTIRYARTIVDAYQRVT